MGPIRINKNTIARILALISVFFFAADVLDLRDELLNTDAYNSCFDNNITTGIHSSIFYNPSLVSIFRWYRAESSSAVVSNFHVLPYSNRAPPAWS